jgi:amino acid adenylation domain-containing protein
VISGARCHALRVRLAEAVHPEALFAPGWSRLWVEDIPAGSAEPVAQRLREAEMSRAATGLRCTLLRYRDRVADLVLVADRGFLDAAGLRAVAAALTGADPVKPAGTEVAEVTAAAAPDWASAADPVDAGSVELVLPLSEAGTADSWRTALAITLVRYASVDSPGWAVIGTDRGAVRVTPGAPAEPTDDPAAAGLSVSDVDFGIDEYRPCLAPPLPLTFSLWRKGDTVRLRCDHQAGRISPAQVGQFTHHLAHVHRQVVANLDVAVDAVELLDAAERERVAALGRPDPELTTTPVRIDAAFRAVAARTPELVALTDGEVSLTYQELDERSDAVASGLRALGVSDGDRVGVCLERTAELVVTLLGVLKAGAAYVPTDPAYPAERLAYTAQNANLRLVLTRLPEFPGASSPVTPDDVIAAGTEPVTSSVSADDPAYVIYTSGSTGRPKGVVVPHRNVIALVDATRDEYALGSSDVWSLFHSSAFDVSVWEIFGCLLTGGRLVVVPYFVSREPEKFRDLLVTERVTVLSQTPSAFAQLLEVPHQDLVVRLVVFAGEPLDQRALLPWFDAHPESACRVVNMFGITETTVHSTHQTVTRRHALAGSRSVGPGLPGWYLYVMDPSGRLQPPGVAGEIWVGGAGVTSGYLGQDDLTAQRFTEDPVQPGGRVYHSGDLGRLRPDGALEHLGRIDSQVKVRGFRIELDEIRAVLLENPDVRTAAVVVRRSDPDDAATVRIDAYVVLAAGSSGVHGATSSVRKRAAEILPDYMVPASVTALDSLPLTTNGKLDAAKLPPPAIPAAPVEASADGEDLASRLREVWGSVLGVPVGLDDDFFELGGNSLFAVRIGARMREGGLPSLQLRELYRNPTIRSVVSALSPMS